MRAVPETRVERWRRLWHLHGRSWIREQGRGLFVAIIFVARFIGVGGVVTILLSRVGQSRLLVGLSPSGQFLLSGTLLEFLGWTLLRSRLKRRRGARVASFWDLRLFVGELGMIVIGAALLMKAGGLI